MKLLLRACGFLALFGLIGAGILAVGMLAMFFVHGVTRETWWMFALVLFGVVWFVIQREQIIRLVTFGLTGRGML